MVSTGGAESVILFGACVLGFFPTIRIREIANLAKQDIRIETPHMGKGLR